MAYLSLHSRDRIILNYTTIKFVSSKNQEQNFGSIANPHKSLTKIDVLSTELVQKSLLANVLDIYQIRTCL